MNQARAAQFGFLILEIATLPHNKQQETALAHMNVWLADATEAHVREVIEVVLKLVPGHLDHPTIVAILEFLEGKIALIRILSGYYGG